LAREAALYPLRDLSPAELTSIRVDDVRPITYKDFMLAMDQVRPSVSPNEVRQVETWAREFGSEG
jgi:SpoVK/Ycf46/Vps4 family AAA+-type ATPase